MRPQQRGNGTGVPASNLCRWDAGTIVRLVTPAATASTVAAASVAAAATSTTTVATAATAAAPAAAAFFRPGLVYGQAPAINSWPLRAPMAAAAS